MMEENSKNRIDTEDILFNKDFLFWAKTGKATPFFDPDKYLAENPDQKDYIETAVLMIRSIQIEQPKVSDCRIEERLHDLKKIAHKRHRTKGFVWSGISSVAAVALIILAIQTYVHKDFDIRNYAASLENISSVNKEILLITEEESILLSKDANIKVDEKGNTDVNNKKILSTKEKHAEAEIQQLIVPKGSRASITFSDGTLAYINSDTKVVYPKMFAKNKREIYVDGEIYIEVTPNKESPFIIKTNDIDVRVLGTAFNLSSYSEDKTTSVVLVSGSVNIQTKEKQSVTLKPNSRFEYQSGKLSINQVDVNNYICWKDGYMNFGENSLAEILLKLSRYYGVNITLESADLSNIVCKGKLELKDNIRDVLDNISSLMQISYEMKESEIIIKTK